MRENQYKGNLIYSLLINSFFNRECDRKSNALVADNAFPLDIE